MKKFLIYVCVVLPAVVVFGVSVLLGREADPFDVVWFWSVCGLMTLSVMMHFQKKKLLHKNTENWKRRLRQSEDGLFAVIGRQEKINNGLLDTIAAMEKKHDFERRLADREVANYLGENVELKKILYGTKKVKKININRERTRRDTKEKLKT